VQKTFYEKLTDMFNVKAQAKTEIKKELGELYPLAQLLDWVKRQDAIQARLPYGLKHW
jgi:hypothetical protein